MKIYTRTGDEGSTAVVGGRVQKDDVRVDAYGTIDEVNSFVGCAISHMDEKSFQDMIVDLTEIQHELFDAGGDLAQVGKVKKYKLHEESVKRLEEWIDRYDKELNPITQFVLPGGSEVSSKLHIARVLTRRAERKVVALCRDSSTNDVVRKYLNRLSDFFFTVARVANVRLGVSDIHYRR